MSILNIAGYDVEVVRKPIRHTYLRVLGDGKLRVTAPPTVSERRIIQFIESKKKWIENRLSAAPRCENRGEILLFGKPYHVQFLDGKIGDTHVEGDTLMVVGGEEGLKKFLRQALKEKIGEILYQITVRMGISSVTYRIREMKTRWGSCNTRTRNMSFNLHLVHASYDCIAYVVIHELCHLWVANHSPAFYERVAEWCPEYKELRKALKRIVPYPFGQSK